MASVASGVWNDNLGERDWAIRFATCVLICGLALLAARANTARRERLLRTTTLAQRVLDALAVELTGARTVKDVAEGFVGHAMGTLGATSAMVLTLDADGVLRTLTWHGRSGSGADHYQEIPLTSDLPGAVAVREGTDVHYRSVKEIVAAFPDLAGYYATDRSLHLLPLHRDGTTYGLLAITFPPDLFTPSEDGFLHSLAGALTSAVRRAAELQDNDAATQRTVLLAEASMTLSRSLDMDTTVAEVGRLLVPRFADWCSLQLLRDGRLETVSLQHRGPRHHGVGTLADRRLPDPDGRTHRVRPRRAHRADGDLPVHPRRAHRGDRHQSPSTSRSSGDWASPAPSSCRSSDATAWSGRSRSSTPSRADATARRTSPSSRPWPTGWPSPWTRPPPSSTSPSGSPG